MKTDENKPAKDESDKFKFTGVFLFFAILVFVAFALIPILTYFSWYPLGSYGPIGDTIGGITGPILSIAGSYLVYQSFTAQIRANKELSDEIKKNHILREYDLINELISTLIEDYAKLAYANVRANLAIDHFLSENLLDRSLSSTYITFFRDFAYILDSADFSSRKIYFFQDPDGIYKRVLRTRFDNFYATKLSFHVDRMRSHPKFSQYFKLKESELVSMIDTSPAIQMKMVLNLTNIIETINDPNYRK